MPAQGTPMPTAALGTLAITLMARTDIFRREMGKAIAALKKFNMEAEKNKAVLASVVRSTQASTLKIVKGVRTQVNTLTAGSQKTRSEMQKTGKVAEQETKKMMSRGKQQLGAVLSFQEGVSRFIKLNLRWFVVWRSLWFLWGKLTEGMENLKVVMHETSLALRTGVDVLDNEVEILIKRNQLTKEAIRFTAQHTKSLRDYIKSFYYLTTAGLSWNVARQTIQTTMTTAIALDEDAIATTRTLTSLYNVFGKTLTNVHTPTEKMQKIAAILTATFKEQDIEMADYNKALTYVGALSATAGVSLETLVASLGVLGTHFVKSSKGGTALARSFARLLKYPERLAEVTGYAFDPTQPLQFEQAMRLISERLREGAVEGKKFAVSTGEAAKILDLLGLRGIRIVTLAANFEKLADQIRLNKDATFDMVEAMRALVESDPSAQLEILSNAVLGNIVAIGKGIVQTQAFSYQLVWLNKLLEKTISLSEDLGRSLGYLLGSFGKIAAALIAWKLPKILASLSGMAASLTKVSVSALALSSAFVKSKVMTTILATAIATNTRLAIFIAKLTSLKAIVIGLAVPFAKFLLIFKAITSAFDAFGLIYDAFTGSYTKKAKQFALDQVFIEKGWLSSLLSLLDLRNLSYRIANYKLIKEWERVEEAHERQLRKEKLSTEEHAAEMQLFALNWWNEQNSALATAMKKRLGLITDKDDDLKAERIRIETETQNEIRKLQLSGLEFELYTLDQRIQMMKAKGIEANLIETYLDLKRWTILKKSTDKAHNAYQAATDTILKIQRTGLDQQLLNIKKAAKEREKWYALETLARIREQFMVSSVEAQIISDSMKAIEDETIQGLTALWVTRWTANEGGLTKLLSQLKESIKQERQIKNDANTAIIRIEKVALGKMFDLVKDQINFSNEQLIAGTKKDLSTLEINYEKRKKIIEKAGEKIAKSKEISDNRKMTAEIYTASALLALETQYGEEELAIVTYLNEKRSATIAKIDAQDFDKRKTRWHELIEEVRKTEAAQLKIVEEERKKVLKAKVGTAEEEKQILEDLAAKRIEIEANAIAAIDALRKKEGLEILKYIIKLKKGEVAEVEEGDQAIAESVSKTWATIKSAVGSASTDYLEQIGDLSDSVQRIFQTMYQGIEEVLTASFMKMVGLEEEYGLESMRLVNERREESKRSLKEQLEEGRISRKRYYAELDELDRRYTEEIEKRQTGLVKTLSDLGKSLTKAVLAELSKRLAGKIALKIKEWAVDAKDIAIKSFEGYAEIPWVGIPLAIAAIAAIWAGIKQFSAKKLAKGGIFEGAQSAIIGEEGPEAVVPLTREGGRLVLSDQGRRIISPLLSLENKIPNLLQAIEDSQGLVRLSPMAASTLGSRGTTGKPEQRVQIDVTFQGDTIDFSGSIPMIDDITTVDRVYENVWLPAKQRRIERLRETIAEVIE